MVCILVYAVLGIGADLIVRLIERLAMPWRRQVSVR
jgi:sulfonate transport system permease protein